MSIEANFDGLIGPSHSYSGLSPGNVASETNKDMPSSPRAACLQGLEKAYKLAKLGVPQAVLPIQERPSLQYLTALGFQGRLQNILEEVDALTLANIYAASSMWTANAATVAPSTDTQDRRMHIVPANLHYQFHRSTEAKPTMETLEKVFGGMATIHAPLPGHVRFGDEGAANHMRFTPAYGEPGVHLFAYGTDGITNERGELVNGPKIKPARQTLAASQALARLLNIPLKNVVFAQTSPQAIDGGAFHNDVISTNNGLTWLLHEQAYVDTPRVISDVQQAVGSDLFVAMAKTEDLSLTDVVESYVFNSQIVTLPSGEIILIAPREAEQNPRSRTYIEKTISDPKCPISRVEYVDLQQSMRNGGGPACLRLRVVMSDVERQRVRGRVFLDDALYGELTAWAERNYRETMLPKDLRDPNLVMESLRAFTELKKILEL